MNFETGDVTATVAVGPNPDRLAISIDGTTLYVGINGTGSVKQYSAHDFTFVREVLTRLNPCSHRRPLTISRSSQGQTTASLSPLPTGPDPGSPSSMLVSSVSRRRRLVHRSCSHRARTADRLYAYVDTNSSASISRLTIAPTGISIVDTFPTILPLPFGRSFEFGTGTGCIYPAECSQLNQSNLLERPSTDLIASNSIFRTTDFSR